MNRIVYFFAAVYQGIKEKRPEGAPYFNLCIAITGAVLFIILHCLMILKIWFHVNLFSSSKQTFLIWTLGLGAVFYLMVRIFLPLDAIIDIDVPQKDAKKMRLIFMLFYFVGTATALFLAFMNAQSMAHTTGSDMSPLLAQVCRAGAKGKGYLCPAQRAPSFRRRYVGRGKG